MTRGPPVVFLSKLLSLFRAKRQSSEPATPSVPTVAFDSKGVTASVKADVLSTLSSVGDIPEGKLTAVGKVAVASVERGRDLHMLHNAIMSGGIAGMTERRAAEIARHVHDRATSIMDVERQKGAGIQEAVWMYSGAPCYPNTEEPSPEQIALNAAHKAADRRQYRVQDGLSVGGKRTWPGREMGCKCLSRPVVEGFS